MAAVAAFASSDTGRFLHAAGVELPGLDPLVAVNLKAAQFAMSIREEREPTFEEKFGG